MPDYDCLIKVTVNSQDVMDDLQQQLDKAVQKIVAEVGARADRVEFRRNWWSAPRPGEGDLDDDIEVGNNEITEGPGDKHTLM